MEPIFGPSPWSSLCDGWLADALWAVQTAHAFDDGIHHDDGEG